MTTNYCTDTAAGVQKLKEQEAAFGLYTPPYILTEIEDLEMQIREVEGQGAPTPSDAQADSPGQIGILFLAANPSGTEPLRLDHEARVIDQALQMAEFRDRFVIWQHWAVRIGDLPELLLRHKPAIVHFSGHGSDAGEIILENDEGQSFVVPARALTGLFGVLRDNIRCVVLNACYSQPQAQAIAEVVDCVVGMPGVIGDQASILLLQFVLSSPRIWETCESRV